MNKYFAFILIKRGLFRRSKQRRQKRHLTLTLLREGGLFRPNFFIIRNTSIFGLLSFPLVLSAIKTVSWLWQNFTLILPGGNMARPKMQLQLYSCNPRSYFLVYYVFPLVLRATNCDFWLWRKSKIIERKQYYLLCKLNIMFLDKALIS